MSIYAERDCYESDQEWRQAIARECRKEEYLDRLEEEKEDQEEEEITLDEAIEDMINLKENMEVPRAGAIDLAIKALELKAKMEQDCEALKNKIPKVNLTESYQYCFLTEYLEVQDGNS